MPSSKNIKQQAQQAKENLSIKSKFIPGFEKRREAFLNAPALRNGARFPYFEEPIELAYNSFISDIVNPLNSSFYGPKDQDNIPISLPNNESCKQLVLRIIRHRLVDGSEKLTSVGQIVGYDYYGNRKTFSCDQPEKYNIPVFDIHRDFNPKKKVVESFSKGIISTKDVYELDFTPENVDQLYAKRPKNEIYFRPNSRNFQRISLYIKDWRDNGGQTKEVFYNNIEESLKLFKEKPFDYLWRKDYLSRALKEEMLMQEFGVQDPDKQQAINTISPDIKNSNAYK